MIKTYFVVDFKHGRCGSTHAWARDEMGWTETEFSKADIVIFPGSASDTDPALYGEERDPRSFVTPASQEWDRYAIGLIRESIKNPKRQVLFGICRGLQIIHVAMGGKLTQHVNGHGGGHDVLLSNLDGSSWNANFAATHHQQVPYDNLEAAKGTMIGSAYDGKRVWEVEAVMYPYANAFAVQFHPEWCNNAQLNNWIKEYAEYLQKLDMLKEPKVKEAV